MPLPQRWHKTKKSTPPAGFDYVEPVLEALEHELRDKVKESNSSKRKTESMWPVHQINWQKSRYVYDLYYTHERISRQVYDHCISQKLIDAALIAKWKKPGYEKLCSTYVINPSNYKFGTTSICRVPQWDRGTAQKSAQDVTTGCLGCASGKGAGPQNIFGNKYGQNLAAVQIAREKRLEEQQAASKARQAAAAAAKDNEADDDDSDEEDDATDDDDDDDYGPSPAAGIWAGSQKLQGETEQITNPGEGEEETDDDDDDDDDDDEGPSLPPPKKIRQE
jgi:bud site selection protein 31